MICHNNKIIFIPIPKCASTSVVFFIKKYYYKYGHGTALNYINNYKDDWNNYYKFFVTRSPYDRLVSAYFMYDTVITEKMLSRWGQSVANCFYFLKQFSTFKQFVMTYIKNIEFSVMRKRPWFQNELTCHFYPQYWWTYGANDETINGIHRFRFENLHNLHKTLASQCNITGEFPHRERSSHDHYLEYYNSDMRNIVYSKYKQDFHLFGYET